MPALNQANETSDEGDPGLLLQSEPEDAAVNQFLEALALHKHFGRETDPPML